MRTVVGRDGEAMVVDSGCTVLFAASDASDEKAMVCATPMAPTPRTPMAPTRLTEGARRRKKETILWASRPISSCSHVLYTHSCTRHAIEKNLRLDRRRISQSGGSIYIRGTRPPPTADETDTESEQEDREDTESDHSIRPVTEREQEDRDEIESDQFIQASPHDSGWVVG